MFSCQNSYAWCNYQRETPQKRTANRSAVCSTRPLNYAESYVKSNNIETTDDRKNAVLLSFRVFAYLFERKLRSKIKQKTTWVKSLKSCSWFSRDYSCRVNLIKKNGNGQRGVYSLVFRPFGGIDKTCARHAFPRVPTCLKCNSEALARRPQPMPRTHTVCFFRVRSWA